MIVRQTTNREDIKRVLCDPIIYDTITDDSSVKIEDFEPPINDDYLYIGAYVNSEIIGLIIYHQYLDGEEIHVQVLPEFRKEYAQKFLEQSLPLRRTLALYAEIPALYKNVLNFALLNNFEVIDTLKDEYMKGGKTYNIKVLRYENGIY